MSRDTRDLLQYLRKADLAQIITQWREHQVNVIGHHDGAVQFVFLAIAGDTGLQNQAAGMGR